MGSLAMRRWFTVLLMLALFACVPGVAEYTKTEAPAALRLDGSTTTATLSFAPGSEWLSAAQARRLARLVQSGAIRPADRVEVAAAGSESLARGRIGAISRQLLRYGIVATGRRLADVPANRAVVTIEHVAVTLPPCPNWSKAPSTDFTNELPSDFGCADAINLGMMVANPADLAGGRTLGAAPGKPEVAAIDRYQNDQVTPLVSAMVGPILTPPSGAPPTPPATP
jgi:pilus assembly protein CpaD